MALFRRRRSSGSPAAAAIAAFWEAWPRLRGRLAARLDEGKAADEETTQELDGLLQQIHPSLGFRAAGNLATDRMQLAGLDISDFSTSALEDLAALDDLDGGDAAAEADTDEARYSLTVTGGGDDDARVLSERWLRSAPSEPHWRFYPAVQAQPERLAGPWHHGDHTVDLSHAVLALRVDQSRLKIEVGVYHPDTIFLDEEARSALARTVVLLAVGEDDMVRWVSDAHALTDKPLDPLPPSAMPSVVEQLLGSFGGSKWVRVQGRIPFVGAFQIGLRYPLHRRDFPAFTLYVLITVPYADSGKDRLPAEGSAASLRRFETDLDKRLGSSGAMLAQRTMAGQRQYHIYVDPNDEKLLASLEELLEEWQEGRATLSSFTDPQWQAITEFARPLKRKLDG